MQDHDIFQKEISLIENNEEIAQINSAQVTDCVFNGLLCLYIMLQTFCTVQRNIFILGHRTFCYKTLLDGGNE